MNTKIKSVSVDENKNKKCFGSVNNELIEHPPPPKNKKKLQIMNAPVPKIKEEQILIKYITELRRINTHLFN